VLMPGWGGSIAPEPFAKIFRQRGFWAMILW
jgi:hypothetical protein